MNLNKKKNIKISLTIITITVALGIFIFGYMIGRGQLEFERGYKPKLINRNIDKPQDVDFSLFWKVWNKIDSQYLGEVDKQTLVYSAIKGLVAGTGDPYSNFMDPSEAKEFLSDIDGEFSGIGAEVGIRNNNLTIIAPLPSSPAEKAGLLAGDVISEIDGIDASLYTIEEAVTHIRGEEGTEVTLKITREGKFTNREFKVKREAISVDSVNFEIKGSIAYIQITQFNEDALGLVKKYFSQAKSAGAKGLIIDLRNNPGGYLDSAVDISDLFVPKGKVIVSEESKNGRKDEYKAVEDPITMLPIVVLVNEGSASASEIFAGAIKDYNLGVVIGEKTFGKGTVQDFEQYDDSSALRLTVAKWLTPNGVNISEAGIEPDIVVELTEDDFNAGRDPQLDRALQELK